MAERSLEDRIETLEQKVGDLEKLPARMDAMESQILQLRGEMRDGFSAIDKRFGETDRQMRTLHEEMLTKFGETNRHMRVLHEEVLRRISLLGEG